MPGVGPAPDPDQAAYEKWAAESVAEPLGPEAIARLEADAVKVIARYPRSRSALLPLLHLVQSEQGYVTPDGVEFCARMLDLTPAEVTAVATFYSMYKRVPTGEYAVGVCTNTLCAVMGGDEIFARLREHLGIGNNQTTEDGKVTLEHLECNAACDYAPVVMVNWEFFDNQTPESAISLVEALRAGKPPTPTRGASLRSFRDTERLLAGFYDGRADEGPAAGPATLAGAEIARRQQGGDTGPGSSKASLTGTDGITTGYGKDGGPSASDAPLTTSASDPANSQTPGAADENTKAGNPTSTGTASDTSAKGKK